MAHPADQPAPASERGQADIKPTIKQAVVVIHGMGEQVPMQTLRSFVHAVWETDLSLTEASDPNKVRTKNEAGEPVNKTWIVPDTRTGSLELSRITTAAADTGVRTDFYEFYWADIMQGTTLQHVTAWVSGLLLRWPHQVPRNVIVVWIVLWCLTIASLWFALSGLLGLGGIAAENPIARWLSRLDHERAEAIGACLCIVGALLGAGFLLSSVPDKPKRHASSVLFAIFVPVFAGWALYWAIPWEHVLKWPALSLAVSAAIAAVIRGVLVPYFGDVARYVRAAPETVAKRAEIRQRGLELLARLHNPAGPHPEIRPAEHLVDVAKPVPPQEVDAALERGAPPPVVPAVPEKIDRSDDYVRIIVVAHSLGSIIAYDILHHYWNTAGPTRSSPPDFDALQALNELDEYVRRHSVKDAPPLDLSEFRRLQRRASAAIGGSGKWRITDLVTVGSPLTHADFMLAQDDECFRALIRDRQIPVSPPVLDGETNSFLIQTKLSQHQEPEVSLHHAAVFSAVRWVNIFDPHAFLLGDVVSGPLRDHFGKGIMDWAVAIKRHWPPIVRRLVTHTLYWSMDVGSTAANNDAKAAAGTRKADGAPDHIVLLRSAIALADVAPEVARKKEADTTPTLVV